jgi:hypothetical protein
MKKWKVRLHVGFLALALTAPSIVIAPTVGYAQTQTKENRDNRQGNRQESRTQKAECKAGDDKTRSECRQEKRDTKQDSRGAKK